MRAPISVVIPSLNAATALPACLAALVEGLQAGLIREVILSDGGSTDGTRALADGWGAEVVSGAPSRGGQLRRGCDAAQGAWLLVLHADTVLAPGWSDAVQDHMAHRAEGAGWFRLRFDQRGLQCRVCIRSRSDGARGGWLLRTAGRSQGGQCNARRHQSHAHVHSSAISRMRSVGRTLTMSR